MSGPETPADGQAPADPQAAPDRPVLRVVSGDPTPEELAALTAVVASRAGGEAPEGPQAPQSRWADRGAALRRPLDRGPGAWRASAWPR